ncbi:MAG TPA: hypothetical protein VGN12_06880 [Pirellulales bacterium]
MSADLRAFLAAQVKNEVILNMNPGMVEAAHHEAGHVVAGHFHSIPYGRVAIFYCEAKERWFGQSGRLRKKPHPSTPGRAIVSLAGVLAEAKYIASQRYNLTVQFASDAPLHDLLRFIGEPRREECPGSFRTAFTVPDDASHMLDVSGEGFSSSDQKIFLEKSTWRHLNLRDVVKQTMALLDQAENWAALQAIAHQLCAKRRRGSIQLRSLRFLAFAPHLPPQ